MLQVDAFHKRLKLSRLEYQRLLFIVSEKSRYVRADPKYYQDLVTDHSGGKPLLNNAIQLAAYMADRINYTALSAWEIPKMPFSAKTLIEAGVPKGKLLSKYLDIIRQEWKRTNFKADNEQLVTYAHQMIEEGKFKVR